MRVGIAGFGTIGKVVGAYLDRGIDGVVLAAVSARDIGRAERATASFTRPVPVLSLAGLAEAGLDIVVECAPASLLRDIAEPALKAGRTLITLSCGALLDNFDLVDLARRHGGRILVPTGALLGLDAVQAAAERASLIARVHMITTKAARGGSTAPPYLVERGISVYWHRKAAYASSAAGAREAARGFPANVNVAAALALAGIGPDRTTIEIWADPEGGPQYSLHRGRGRHGRLLSSKSRTCRASKTPGPAGPDAAFGRRAAAQAGKPAGDWDLTATDRACDRCPPPCPPPQLPWIKSGEGRSGGDLQRIGRSFGRLV